MLRQQHHSATGDRVRILPRARIARTWSVVHWKLVDRLTPYDLWREVTEEQNVAVAILMGLIGLGLAIVIAAAIH